MGTFFEYGKDKAAIGEGWAPPFISFAQDTMGLLSPLRLRLLCYGKPLPIYYKHVQNTHYECFGQNDSRTSMLEYLWSHEKMFETGVVRGNEC